MLPAGKLRVWKQWANFLSGPGLVVREIALDKADYTIIQGYILWFPTSVSLIVKLIRWDSDLAQGRLWNAGLVFGYAVPTSRVGKGIIRLAI
jgi:hypothetical protein